MFTEKIPKPSNIKKLKASQHGVCKVDYEILDLLDIRRYSPEEGLYVHKGGKSKAIKRNNAITKQPKFIFYAGLRIKGSQSKVPHVKWWLFDDDRYAVDSHWQDLITNLAFNMTIRAKMKNAVKGNSIGSKYSVNFYFEFLGS